MTYADFETLVLSKSIGRTSLPTDGTMLHRLQTALEFVGTETLPIILQDGTATVSDYWRAIDDSVTGTTTYLRKPISSITAVIDMDEDLMGALALYIMAGLERVNAGSHMGLYNKEIGLYNERQIEAELGDFEQDRKKYSQFDNQQAEVTYGF